MVRDNNLYDGGDVYSWNLLVRQMESEANRLRLSNIDNTLSFSIDHSLENPAWDAFVVQCPGAQHDQTTMWAKVRRAQGWQSYRILVEKDSRLVGGAQVQYRRIGRLFTLGFISRGPVSLSSGLASAVAESVIRGLKQTAHTYLVVLPNYEWANVVPVLEVNGFYAKPNLLPPSNLVTATIIIDLTQDLEVILSKMRRNTQRNIRRGIQSGMIVTEGGEKDLETFYRLMCQLCVRRNTAPQPASIEILREYWRRFAPAGMVKVFMGRLHDVDVVSALAFIYGNTIYVTKIGWSGEHEELRPNEYLWWELIKWAKAAGLQKFDFVQIMPEHARAVLNGQTVDDPYWGVTHFKVGFGGDIVMIPSAYYRSFNLVGQFLLKMGGARFLSSDFFIKWAGRLARGSG